MKKTLIVIAALVVIAVIVAYLLGLFRPGTAPAATPPTSSPAASTPVASSPVSSSTKPPASSPVATSTAPTLGNVSFAMYVSPPTGSGLSRTFSAQISNTGSTDAHNVWVEIEATSAGTTVQISGQNYIIVNIGNMNAGETITKQVTLEFTLEDSVRILQNGAHFVLTVNSDEKTQSFAYDYVP